MARTRKERQQMVRGTPAEPSAVVEMMNELSGGALADEVRTDRWRAVVATAINKAIEPLVDDVRTLEKEITRLQGVKRAREDEIVALREVCARAPVPPAPDGDWSAPAETHAAGLVARLRAR